MHVGVHPLFISDFIYLYFIYTLILFIFHCFSYKNSLIAGCPDYFSRLSRELCPFIDNLSANIRNKRTCIALHGDISVSRQQNLSKTKFVRTGGRTLYSRKVLGQVSLTIFTKSSLLYSANDD